jgi:hypothetical protein
MANRALRISHMGLGGKHEKRTTATGR